MIAAGIEVDLTIVIVEDLVIDGVVVDSAIEIEVDSEIEIEEEVDLEIEIVEDHIKLKVNFLLLHGLDKCTTATTTYARYKYTNVIPISCCHLSSYNITRSATQAK